MKAERVDMKYKPSLVWGWSVAAITCFADEDTDDKEDDSDDESGKNNILKENYNM